MRRRFRLFRRPLRHHPRLLILVLLLGIVLYFRFNWLPMVQKLVSTQIDTEVSDLINEAVDAYLARGQLQYDDLIHLERTADGRISAARVDLAQVNQMKSVILRELGERLPDRVSRSVRIPVGNVLLPALLSGRGGSLPVRVVSLQSTNAELASSSLQTGINQTLHQLELRVDADLLLLTPAGLLSRQVSTTVPIAQTILVGEVPKILLNTGD
ncbi:MAG: hypothetical protein IIY70_05215 [Oscillospiraceae bacterium]|nr:hypothetical protein [Oscillospiraceae bacterium]